MAYLLVGLAWIMGSDLVVAWFYHDDLHALVYASTLKGALFVILTSTLLHVVLAMRRADYAPGARALDPFEFRKPLIAFSLLGLGIASAGYVVYLLEANGIRARADAQLESSARLAATEFKQWHDAQLRTMRQIKDSPFTTRALTEWRASRSSALESLLLVRLEAIRASHDHVGVAIVAPDGATLLAVGDLLSTGAGRQQIAGVTAATPDVASRWVAVKSPDGARRPVLELVTTLNDDVGDSVGTVAFLVAQSDVRWPPSGFPSLAGDYGPEVTLARLDGDSVEFIQQSAVGSPAHFGRVPRSRTDLFVVQAATATPAPFTAPDADGRDMLVVAYPVEATPWYVVASLQQEAILGQLRKLLLLIAGMSALGFVAAGALVLPWWRSVRASANALVASAELRAEEMAARLGWATRYANDVILLLDEHGRILDANDRAEQVYGYSRDELLAKDVFALRLPDDAQRSTARAQFESVKSDGSRVFETIHVSKDGTTLPVEVSSRKVALRGRTYVQSIVRDVSERRRSEDQLRDSEAQYRLLFRSNPHPMWVYDVESLRFLAVNDAAVEHYGYTEAEFLAMTIADIRPANERGKLSMNVAEHADDLLHRAGIWRHCRKDGMVIEVEITSHRIQFAGRRARLVLANDVTDRLQAERALRASEERYRRLFENASDGILVLGIGRGVLAANTEYQVMLGYSMQELLGMPIATLLDEREHERLAGLMAELRNERVPGTATWVHRRKDGSRFTGEVRIRRLPGGEVLATVRDLTEILTTRRRLERQRDLYDLLSQCNQAIVKVRDRRGLLQSVPRLAVERGRFMFAWIGEPDPTGGIVPTAIFGEDHGYVADLRLTTNSDSAAGTGPSGRAIREGRPVVANDFLKDPATAPWHESARRCGIGASAAFPIFTGGKVSAALMLYASETGYFDPEIVATLEEMTQEVSHALDALHTRRELEDHRLLLDSLINASDALVFAFDLQGRAILMNDACARAMGGTRETLLGKRRDATLPPAIAQAHEMNDRYVIETGEHQVVEEHNLESGVERIYLSVKYPLRDVDGHMYAVGGIATDITELRRMERELAESNRLLEEKVAERTRDAMEARARAEESDRAKTLFLSSMSHELRSPLHSIIGFTSVLLEGLEGELTPMQQEHLRVVSESSLHLLAIINDLLDMSKIEAGAVALERKRLPIQRPLKRVMQRFRLQAQQKGLTMSLEGPATELWWEGDERRLEQVVSNLVSNAIKFTAEGSVLVSYGCEADRLRVDVRDTGPGIAPEDQGHLFKRFSQLRPSPGRVTEGTGLGLAIAAGLVEAMGGEIGLQSDVGAGSVFTVLLP